MLRLNYIIILAIMSLSLLACTACTKNQDNICFGELDGDIFNDIVEINYVGSANPLTDEKEIQKLSNMLQALSLQASQTKVDDYLKLDGQVILTLVHSDGTEDTFSFTSKYLYFKEVLYTLDEGQATELFDLLKNS